MSNIESNIASIRRELPEEVTLACVSKFKPSEDILEAYRCGERVFAESRPQEFCQKAAELPKDICWQFIGHLQTNKLKMVLPYASLIQSVDTLHLIEAIDAAISVGTPLCLGDHVDILLECHIAHDATKQGFSIDEADDLISDWPFRNIRLRGLMGMASYTEDTALIEQEFLSLKALFDKHKGGSFDTLSMGMSGDWAIAKRCGATMVRIGSSIFGAR